LTEFDLVWWCRFCLPRVATMVQPNAKSTAIVSGLLFVLTLSGIRLAASTLASSEKLTIVGGFVCSILFFFALMTVGNLERETKWLEVIFCLVVSLIVAATVHPVCTTTCFLFSAGILYYMNTMSKQIQEREAKEHTK